MNEQQKIEVLKNNGWYQWHSQTTWVNKDVFEMYDKVGVYYFKGVGHEGHQLTVDHAYSLQTRYDKKLNSDAL